MSSSSTPVIVFSVIFVLILLCIAIHDVKLDEKKYIKQLKDATEMKPMRFGLRRYKKKPLKSSHKESSHKESIPLESIPEEEEKLTLNF